MSGDKIPETAVFTSEELGFLYGLSALLAVMREQEKSKIWQSAQTQHRIKMLTIAHRELWEMLESKTEADNVREGEEGVQGGHSIRESDPDANAVGNTPA